MFLLAHKLFVGDLAEPRGVERTSQLVSFDSVDILRIGVNRLAEKINQFNEEHVRRPFAMNASYPGVDVDDAIEFADIYALNDLFRSDNGRRQFIRIMHQTIKEVL